MPYSPKSKHYSNSNTSLLNILLISCSALLLFTASFWLGVVFGECSMRGGTWSVRVLWRKNNGDQEYDGVNDTALDTLNENAYVTVHANDFAELGVRKHKVMAFVGIMTGYDSSGRRQSLRKTWMPSDRQSLLKMEESKGLAFRFIIGNTNDQTRSQELQEELLKYDDFMVLDFQEDNANPNMKTYLFFKYAYAIFDCEFYVKVQDDIYLRPDRLSLLLAKDRPHTQTYLGCMRRSDASSNPQLRFAKKLIGSSHVLHAQSSFFALSADTVANLVEIEHKRLRMFPSEDVTIGAWMLAMNINFENNKLLCQTNCSLPSIVVTDFPRCSGLCDAENRLLELHEQPNCSMSPTYPESTILNVLEYGYLLQTKSRKQHSKVQNMTFTQQRQLNSRKKDNKKQDIHGNHIRWSSR